MRPEEQPANRQQLLLRDAKSRLELAERGIERSRYDWEKACAAKSTSSAR
jgi:hypothetical protein